ncbi:hypothetical protein CDEST_05267 [Colletotrichum destructivum]|uniref:Uncharacterized protein n=1 Tax=Colletotrichum destructivum TaxID=34406 RepID=A0AAX4IA68_9PEZI|nr:hypothetical protein CDEST_05267 [Colletotrichum destructivum]
MKISLAVVAFLSSFANAMPQPRGFNARNTNIKLQARVISSKPGGDGGGYTLVERQANEDQGNRPVNKNQRSKAAGGNGGSNLIQQLQETFDRNNPNGTPAAPGDPDDLNGDGVINVFEAGAQAS